MHLYVHVPFCARRCSYCDFAIAVRREVPSDLFADAVLREWAGWQDDPAWSRSPVVRTVYFGGGTPSRLAPRALGRIVERISRDRPLAPGAEITLEANPDDVSAERVAAWRAVGVNRVSLGVQSLDPAVLRWMRRTHTAAQVPRAVELLRAGGIGDVSLDLIFALPAELERDWEADLAAALALAPEHLSLYGLTIEPRTPLARWLERGAIRPVDEHRYAREYLTAHQALEAGGFEHYEVSNFARPGRRARHNSAYWSRAPYIGLGPSAHSGLGDRRRWNRREWSAYARAVLAGEPAVEGVETLDAEALRLERLYLGLRTGTGLPVRQIPAGTVEEWVSQGWATVVDGEDPGGTRSAYGDADREPRVRLTVEGWLRLDALVSSLAAKT
ncbi:MAG TPA: radical SAM family heme chaperone HemW [Gemmatimonadales bacterium]|nr:radical SAM family heme chaperone HemW [Gemmatimonadales bacterium]